MAALAPPMEAAAPPEALGEQQPTEQQNPYGINNRDLPEELVNALKAAVTAFQKQEEHLRRKEVMRDSRNRNYEIGNQHLYWNQTAGGFSTYAGGGVVTVGNGSIQAPNYVDDYNIFQPNCRILQAILTQTDTGIAFEPDDPTRPEDNEAAETSESYRHFFDRANDVKRIRTKTIRFFLLSSRAVRWTRTEANAELWGLNDAGQPKRMEMCTVYGTLESRVPLLAKSQKQALWCCLSDDLDVKQIKSDVAEYFPEAAKKIKGGTPGLGENAYERNARLGILQGQGTRGVSTQAFEHMAVRQNWWLRKAAFTGAEYDEPLKEVGEGDTDAEGRPMTLGEKLRQVFPEGCHVTFGGDVYVGSESQSMDDNVDIGFPYEGDNMFRLAWMDPMVVIQDSFNDGENYTRELFDTGGPETWLDAEDTEYDAVVKQRASPNAIRQKKLISGQQKMGDAVLRLPGPELSASFIGHQAELKGPLAQFILATPPAIFGASMQDQKTASGYAQARSQAMGQLGPASAALREMDARMYYQAALAAAKNPDHAESIVVPTGDGQNSNMSLAKLTKGKFHAHPDDDSSFPESTEAKRATFDQVLATIGDSPIGLELIQQPENVLTYLRLKGLNEIVLPQAEAADQQQFEIEELLLGSPLPPSPEAEQEAQIQHAADSIEARALGMPELPFMPIPPTSSVPVNEWDYHEWHAKKCQAWLNSSACRKQLASGNQIGVENVVLHWKAHMEALAALMPPPMLAAPPEAGGEPAAKPPNAGAPPGAPTKIANPPGGPGVATM